MMERRLLFGMGGIVIVVLCALALQIVTDVRPPLSVTTYGSRG